MKITHIFAQNFCKFYGKNTLDTDFSMKTVLSGQNEVGKSTVKRIILDVLNCHDENDREITGIRPHDESGAEIDDVDIVRAVTFEISGKAKTLKKVTRQKRNKKVRLQAVLLITQSMMCRIKWLTTISTSMTTWQSLEYYHFA